MENKIKPKWVRVHNPKRTIRNGYAVRNTTPTRPYDPKTDSIERLAEAIGGKVVHVESE